MNRPIDWALTCDLRTLFAEAAAEATFPWLAKLEEAEAFMAERRRQNPHKVLIEVSAQHPLRDGLFPGSEFQARLDEAVKIYKAHRDMHCDVEIYVPGSRHDDQGLRKKGVPADLVSLSAAGITYLAQKGIFASVLHGDDLNDFYKGSNLPPEQHGIYCGGDEALVGARHFKDQGFGRLICISAPAQSRRKQLHYIANGVKALVIPARPDGQPLWHDPTTEVTKNIPSVLNDPDPTFQSPGHPMAQMFRRLRKPGYGLGTAA